MEKKLLDENEIFDEEVSIKIIYEEAVTIEDYWEAVKRRRKIEGGVSEAALHEHPDFFGKGLLDGYWAEYYWWLKGFVEQEKEVDEEKVKEFLKKVSWFWRACKTDIAFGYGDLLSTAYDYLLSNKKASLEVFNDMKERAEKTGNRVALLRVMNRSVTSAMKYKEWQRAVQEANKAEELLPVQGEEELRHFGNIINNRGAAKIRGDIDYLGGIKDLIKAAYEFYLEEKEVPMKHILGIINRLNEAKKKIEENQK